MRSGGFPFCPGRGQSKQTVSVFFSLRLQLTALVSKSGGLCLDSGLDCFCAEGKNHMQAEQSGRMSCWCFLNTECSIWRGQENEEVQM